MQMSSDVNTTDTHHSPMAMGGDMGGMDHSSMENMTDGVSFYCVKGCSDPDQDPCGNGKGQTSTCSAALIDNPTEFGLFFDIKVDYSDSSGISLSSDYTISVMGCTLDVCESECSVTGTTVQGDTICFPSNEGMYMSRDDAELSAVGRGCSGNHTMGDMYMVGSTHADCVDSYSKDGVSVTLTSPASSVWSVSIVAGVTAFILATVQF